MREKGDHGFRISYRSNNLTTVCTKIQCLYNLVFIHSRILSRSSYYTTTDIARYEITFSFGLVVAVLPPALSPHGRLDLLLDDGHVVPHVELHHGHEAVEAGVGIDEPPDGVGGRVVEEGEVAEGLLVVRLARYAGPLIEGNVSFLTLISRYS